MLLIKDGNVHLESGEVRQGYDILIENDKIKKMGKDLAVEHDTEIIDASGMQVFPGFILPCSSVGLVDMTEFRQGDHNETTDPLTPHLEVKYAIDKREVYLQQYYYTGITAFGAAPGKGNILSGQMSVYNTAGKTAKDMCLRENIAVKGNFSKQVKKTYGGGGKAPMTKMAMASMLRKALIEAQEYDKKEEKDFDEKKEVLVRLLKKEIPLVMNAQTAAEIDAVIQIAEDFDLNLILHDVYQAEHCQEKILKNDFPILLGQLQSYGLSICYDTDFDKLVEMQKEGMLIGLSNSGDDGFSGRETLLWSAFRLVQAGADPSDVIRMMTIFNAMILGVDDLIGSLVEGKQADIVLYNRHPLETYDAQVEHMIVAGEVAYQKTGEFEKCCI